jgi:phage terminase large subunit
MVRKTRQSITETVLDLFEGHVMKDHPAYPRFREIKRRIRQEYEYPNRSIIVIRGLDNPDAVRGGNFDVAAAFEATELTEGDWEMLIGSLRNGVMPYQQAIADCNPDRPTHWLNVRAARPYVVPVGLEEFFPPSKPGQTQMTRLLSRHRDNPRLFDHKADKWTPFGADYLMKLQRNTGARFARLFQGRWAASEGLVYPDFDPLDHVLDYGSEKFTWKEIPKSWRRMRSIDFGFTNPFVCQWWAIDPDGRLYLYREIFRTQVPVEDHAKRINDLSNGEVYEVTISDHQASDRASLNRAGIKTQPAIKKDMLRPGIEAVSLRLRKAGDGKPRLFIMRGACLDRDTWLVDNGAPASTEQEFDGYVYPPPTGGKPVKEEPVDLNNHGLDALRYCVSHVDEVARRRFKLRGGRVGTGLARMSA